MLLTKSMRRVAAVALAAVSLSVLATPRTTTGTIKTLKLDGASATLTLAVALDGDPNLCNTGYKGVAYRGSSATLFDHFLRTLTAAKLARAQIQIVADDGGDYYAACTIQSITIVSP